VIEGARGQSDSIEGLPAVKLAVPDEFGGVGLVRSEVSAPRGAFGEVMLWIMAGRNDSGCHAESGR